MGKVYRYPIVAVHECGFIPMTCDSVEVHQLPPGATFSAPDNLIQWTPTVAQANRDFGFAIRTVPDYCGNSVGQSWAVHVAPDVTPPHVVHVWPGAGAVDVAVGASIVVSFDEAIDARSVTPASFRVTSPSGAIAGTFAVQGTQVTFNATGALPYQSVIAVTLTTALSDLSGNALAGDYGWSFTTIVASDTTAPSVPAGLSTTGVTGRVVPLTWNPSTDDHGVAGYRVYRNGARWQSVGTTAATDTQAAFGGTTCYAVSAYDLAGNESASSPPLCVTTRSFSPGAIAWWGYRYSANPDLQRHVAPDIWPDISDATAIAFTTSPLVVRAGGTVWQGDTAFAQVAGVQGATAVATGWMHALARDADGAVLAWGENRDGQLGDGTSTAAVAPVRMLGTLDVVAVAAGLGHSLTLKADGTVWATGGNWFGQLGDGTTTTRLVPVQVAGLTHVAAISARYNGSLALKHDGTVWQWGDNAFGWLPGRYLATVAQVPDLANVVAIARGMSFGLALRADGTVWSWGYNGSGQLGDGTHDTRPTPVRVANVSGVTRIAAGGAHALAVTDDGAVWAWGYNGDGQLGDGTTIDRLLPVRVLDLVAPRAIAAGDRGSMALK